MSTLLASVSDVLIGVDDHPVYILCIFFTPLLLFVTYKAIKVMDRHESRNHLPLPQGPYPVGCVDIMTEYSIKGCLMRLYYPAENGAMKRSMQWPLWLPSKHYLLGYANFIKIWPPLMKALHRLLIGDIYVPAVWNAFPIRGMKFPVIVFSHGLGGCRTTYSTTCVELASQGFIVAAVEHRDGSACLSYYLREINTLFDNENEATESLTSSVNDVSSAYVPEYVHFRHPLKHEKEYPMRNRQVHQRVEECRKALDVLIAINKGEFVNNIAETNFSPSHFENIMDVSRIVMGGHSFGGSTVIQTMTVDARFCIGVALDPWMFPIKDERRCFIDKKQPMLFINTETFQTAKSSEVLQRLFSNEIDRKVVTVRGTVHQNQSDTPFLTQRKLVRRFLGAYSRLDPELATTINHVLMLEFLWKHLDLPVSKTYEKFLEDNSQHLVYGIVVKSNL